MQRLRSVLFWCHLTAGVTAGLVILVMSATGVVLAGQSTVLTFIERGVRRASPSSTGSRVPLGVVLASVRTAQEAPPASVTVQRDPASAVAVSLGRDGTIYVNPYTGAILGRGSARAQAFFRSVEDWHRWLGQAGDWRGSARAITGASNLVFLLLALSGPFLWLPRKWTAASVRSVLWFRTGAAGRARDFNWHNVIGIWCAPVLIVLTLTGVVMSYPWANALLYRLAGSPLPAAGERAGGSRPAAAAIPVDVDRVVVAAVDRVPTWETLIVRLPMRSGAPASVSISDGASWNRFARSQLTLDATTAAVIRWEPYDATSLGQRMRGWVRFAHTGELGGPLGQAVAGVASAGGTMLVWTGLALAIRRLIGWRIWNRATVDAAVRRVPIR